MNSIDKIVKKQRELFASGETLDVAFRKEQLKKLQERIKSMESEILHALKVDLNKNEFEGYMVEVGMACEELSYMIKNVGKLTKPKRAKAPIMHFPSSSKIYRDPYGVVLVMSPWNYPFQLTMIPIIGAIAGGNCVVVKPSNYAPATAKVIEKILEIFNDDFVSVVQGGRDVNTALLDEKFDYIFFTGSPTVGKLVMEKASKHLTPITLELGGKSPCIVTESAKIDLAAKRIVWGKMLNAGQTCVAPDYILVHKSVKAELLSGIAKYQTHFHGENPQENENYPKIINQKHFERLQNLIEVSDNVTGGKCNPQTRQISLAVVDNASFQSEVMAEELFGPILPIITYEDINQVTSEINNRPSPLALYIFSQNSSEIKEVMKKVRFGGGCVNDTIIHLANKNVPFGGVGESGMGSYHGKYSFETFTHAKSVATKSTMMDIEIRYPNPKGDKKTGIVKFFLK